ncbi:MAG: sulfate reduction electron transfer complex DsrMKJOP subunit DsrM [Desulfobaccales bacterium]|jgi:nitrate reductase gamma subunit
MDFFKRHFTVALGAVLGIVLVAYLGVSANLQLLFGVVVPYLALLIFVEGFIYRLLQWSRSPVPFQIPTTAGQQKSLPWIERSPGDKLDNPYTTRYVIGRMALEVLAFRSLFRNLRSELRQDPKHPGGARLIHWSYKWLWLGAIAFHYASLVILLRHLRLFTEPVPGLIKLIDSVDGFLQFSTPVFYLSGGVLVVAVAYLLVRRLTNPMLRYISLASDYFPLLLLLAIGISGILMRYVYKVDVVAVKELTLGLVTLHPRVPAGIGPIFFVHLFLVSVLFAYFPFSKLMHAPGVFLSPTRNMPTNTRALRHVNPWNYPVKFHHYDEYEDRFREAMVEAGIPVEKELE